MAEKLGYDELYKMRLELIRERNLLKEQIKMALEELGVPTKDYPAPVANAVDILNKALGLKNGLPNLITRKY